MGRIGYGYGSEWHLLRYLGRHRNLLNGKIMEVTDCGPIEWLDFGFESHNPWHDAECKGFDFLREDAALQKAWKQYWPCGAGIHNWDAVARTSCGGKPEWILVEAKANLEEIISTCQAVNESSLRKITASLDATKADLGAPLEADWKKPYYQYCNRIAALHFLAMHGVAAKLLFIYFCGDTGDARRTCPKDPAGWEIALKDMHRHVGIPDGHCLEGNIRNLFLSVKQD